MFLHALYLLECENIFQNVAHCWPPCRKTIDHKIAKWLSITVTHQWRPSFAQAQHHHVHARLRHKVVTPETMHNIRLKPRGQQDRVERGARLAEELVSRLLLHR